LSVLWVAYVRLRVFENRVSVCCLVVQSTTRQHTDR
jgi:hypothetical protein